VRVARLRQPVPVSSFAISATPRFIPSPREGGKVGRETVKLHLVLILACGTKRDISLEIRLLPTFAFPPPDELVDLGQRTWVEWW
jgi:hypothetical protein